MKPNWGVWGEITIGGIWQGVRRFGAASVPIFYYI